MISEQFSSDRSISDDACYRSPCQNGGVCLNVHDDYYCQCSNAHYGKIWFDHDVFFVRKEFFTLGNNCELSELKILSSFSIWILYLAYSNPSSLNNLCQPNICNTGRCVPLQTTYYCVCPNDRSGEHCEKRTNFFFFDENSDDFSFLFRFFKT